MVKRIVMLENIEYTIHKPIADSVVKYLKDMLFKKQDIYTEYLNNYEDSEFTSTKNIYDNNTKKEYLEIGYEIESMDDMMLANTVNRLNKYPILEYKDLCFSIRPNTIYTKFIIKFKYHNKSKNAIVSKLNQLKSSSITDSMYGQVDATYYYAIPPYSLGIIKNINELLNTGDDLDTFLNKIATVPIDYINSRTGNYQIPVIKETQPVIGNFETSMFDINKIEKDEYGWVLEFDYRIDIELPTSLLMIYPIIVNNQPLNEIFLPPDEYTVALNSSSDYVKVLNDYISKNEYGLLTDQALLTVPSFDYIPYMPALKPYHMRILSLLLVIDTDNKILLTLDELKSFIRNEDMLTIIDEHKNGSDLFEPFNSILYFEFIEGCRPVDRGLYIDEEGNIRYSKDLDMSLEHKLILNLCTNIDFLKDPDSLSDTELNFLSKYNIVFTPNQDSGSYKTKAMRALLPTNS